MNLRLSIIASTLLLAACDQVRDLPIKYPGQQQEEPNTEAVQDNREKAPITLDKADTMPFEEVELIIAFKDGVEKDPAQVVKLLCGDLGRDDCKFRQGYTGDIIVSMPKTGNENTTEIVDSAKRLFGDDLKYVEPQWNFEPIRKGERQFTPQ